METYRSTNQPTNQLNNGKDAGQSSRPINQPINQLNHGTHVPATLWPNSSQPHISLPENDAHDGTLLLHDDGDDDADDNDGDDDDADDDDDDDDADDGDDDDNDDMQFL